MHPRHWFLFLVALGCGWAIGFFMGSPGVGTSQNLLAAPGENRQGDGGATPVSAVGSASASESDSKSIYSISERIRGIWSHPSARWRSVQFARLAESMAVADIPRVCEEIKASGGTDMEEVMRLLFARWAEVNPRGAIEFARRTQIYFGLSSALGEWAAADPTAAVAWLKSLPTGPDTDALVPDMIPALARIDPAGAFQLLQEKPGEEGGSYYLSEVFGRWSSKDLSAARAAAEGMSAGHKRHTAMTSLAMGWARFDPEAALAWALQGSDRNLRRRVIDATIRGMENLDIEVMTARAKALPDESDRGAMLASLVGVSASRAPEKAIALLGEISATDMRETATNSVIYAIMGTDIDRAATLVGSLSGQRADQPISAVVERLKFTDPARAATLAMRISPNQNDVLGGVLTAWLGSSPDAALAWMEKTSLPANTANRARSNFARWAGDNPTAAVAFVEERGASENLKWAVNAAIQGDLREGSKGCRRNRRRTARSSHRCRRAGGHWFELGAERSQGGVGVGDEPAGLGGESFGGVGIYQRMGRGRSQGGGRVARSIAARNHAG